MVNADNTKIYLLRYQNYEQHKSVGQAPPYKTSDGHVLMAGGPVRKWTDAFGVYF